MSYRCQHCGEKVADTSSRAAKETCYISPNGRHKWQESATEEEQLGYEMPQAISIEDFYGD